jgi:hypothetical protein
MPRPTSRSPSPKPPTGPATASTPFASCSRPSRARRLSVHDVRSQSHVALTGGPRLAANPANSVLNYLYALLEGEATLAARIVGLDPGLGVLHADQPNRDSLAADLMEPVRPIVDRFVLGLLTDRVFATADFHETRQGVCRITPTLAHELALTGPLWARAVGRVAEDVARLLDDGGRPGRATPTPLSGRNRAAARPAGPRSRRAAEGSGRMVAQRCSWCGAPTIRGRRTCSESCDRIRRGVNREAFTQAGPARLRELREAGHEPLDRAARQKLGSRQRERQREENAWNATHPERADPGTFRREVLPAITGVPLRELARRTGLSVGYLARVRRGEEVPHARWWPMLCKRLTRSPGPPPVGPARPLSTVSGAGRSTP